jgi:type II secretory pathway pseudopilin PulG
MKRSRQQQRGFALLIVVLLVALLALAGAALLDLVSFDITISGEHQKVVRAQILADGAMREVVTDSSVPFPDYGQQLCATNLPSIPCPNHRYNYALETGGIIFKNPDNVAGYPPRVAQTDGNSAMAKYTNLAHLEENYEATIDIVRIPDKVFGSGVNTAHAILWEVSARSRVADRSATTDVAAEVYQLRPSQTGYLPTYTYFR